MVECRELLKCEQVGSEYLLKRVTLPATDTYLPSLIPDFFSRVRRGIRIAVVCGESPVWDTVNFVAILQELCKSKDHPIISFKETDIDLTSSSRIAKLVDLRHNDVDGIERTVYAEIKNICDWIMKGIKEETLPSKVSSTMFVLDQLQNDSESKLTSWMAGLLNSVLDSEDVLGIFPAVWLLFFLPGSAYNGYFAKFIDQKFVGIVEYVALLADQEKERLEADNQLLTEKNKQVTEENRVLTEENERLKSENRELRAENERLKNENQELREENTHLKNEYSNMKEDKEWQNEATDRQEKQNEQSLNEMSRTIGGAVRGF